MIRPTHRFACGAALLLACGLRAQEAPRCPAGPADEEGINISVTVGAHPTRVAAVVDSLLAAGGYQVRSSPEGAGRWSIVPRFTYGDDVRGEAWVVDPHPGVQVMVDAEAEADSTALRIAARSLCKVEGGGEMDAGRMVEMLAAMQLAAGVTSTLDTLAAAGVDLAAAVERGKATIQAPQDVAGFRIADFHEYDDPAAGVRVRYTRGKNDPYVDVFVYPGAPQGCDAACGARVVNEEVDGFRGDLPELVRRGYAERMEVRTDETLTPPAGAGWVFGRALEIDMRAGGQDLDSRYYLFAFPGYKIKLRATYPPSVETTAVVRAFVDALLPQLGGS
jgi:hypothetical protein